MSKLERRFISQPITVDTTGSPKIRGYAAVFNSDSENLGGFIERVDPHAFDDTLNEDVRALWNHDPNTVLGRTASGTLRLSVDSKGLAYEIDPPDTQAARDLMTLMQRGDVNQSSFGFYCLDDQWDYASKPAVRTVLKASLVDVSPVTYPAYPDATSEARALFPDGVPATIQESLTRAETKTLKVDGEDLTADCFLIATDKNDTSTWHLPWKFSTEEKTQAHLRDALARFDQLKGVSDAEKKVAWDKLVQLCKEHDIQVGASDAENKSYQLMQMQLQLASLD